jgi:tetratricopeptide (TPR) repeat protein
MISCYRFLSLLFVLLITVPAFSLEWHKAYERGRDRIKSGNCSEGQALMQEALRGNSKADPRTPTYGTMVIEYFPQYYLAICAVEAGRLQEAQRYLKESEGSRIKSSKLAGEYQNLKAKLDGLVQQQQKTANATETKPPAQQQKPPPQQVTQQKPPPPPPQEKKIEPRTVEPVVRDDTAAINSAYRDAREAFRAGRYEDARSAANRVIAMEPNHREARNLLGDIATRQAEEQQARGKQQKIREVEQAIRRGDLDTAENVALALKIQYPTDSKIVGLLQEIENQRNTAVRDLKAEELRKTVERDVLTAYYRGNYDQAIQVAKQNLTAVSQSWRLHFYLGCSYAALSMLEEKDSDARLQLARDYFRRARSLSSSVSIPPYISPKIIDIYKAS